MKDEGEADSRRSPDARRQQVEPVEQVEAVDQQDTRDNHKRYADPTREVNGHRHSDDSSHCELSRESQRCRKPEAVVGDPDGQRCSQREKDDRPTNRYSDHEAGEDRDPTQVGDRRDVRLERSRTINDAESMGDHDAARDGHSRDGSGGGGNEESRAHAGGICGAGHRISRDSVPGCNSNLSAVPNPARAYRAIAALVACRHHNVSRALPPPPDLVEESVHQEDPEATSARCRIDGHGQQFRTLRSVAGPVVKGLHHPAPGAKKPASTGERGGDTISQHE